jgi:phosphatidylglycerophosphate synthase
VGTYFNPANAITASRYLTLPPFLYYLDRGMDQLALAMVLVCGLLDVFDGPVARKFNCTSGFGELFDAATDGICYAFFIATLTLYGKIPWIPMVFFLALGVANMVLRALYTRRVGRTTNYRSFAMERVAAYAVYMSGTAVAGFSATFYAWAIPAVMLAVVLHDAKRMLIDPVPGGAAAPVLEPDLVHEPDLATER